MRHKNSLAMFEYWNSRRGARPAPSRNEIEPSDIRLLLPHVFICEVNENADLIFRLAGTAICTMRGCELKASRLADLWAEDGARNALRIALAVAEHNTPVVLSIDALSESGRSAAFEMLLLPLTGPSDTTNRLIGIMSAVEPCWWLGHDPVIGLLTSGVRFLDPERDPIFLANRPEVKIPVNGMAEVKSRLASGKLRNFIVLDGGRGS